MSTCASTGKVAGSRAGRKTISGDVRHSRLGFWLALVALLFQLAAPLHCAHQTSAIPAELAQLSALPGFELSLCRAPRTQHDNPGNGQTDDLAACLMCCVLEHFDAPLPPSERVIAAFVAPSSPIGLPPQDVPVHQVRIASAQPRAPPFSV